jgi:hypothetical protein
LDRDYHFAIINNDISGTGACRRIELPMPDDFRHVVNNLLFRPLESNPRNICQPELRQAVAWTVEALGHDVINKSIPAGAPEARIKTARDATGFLSVRIPTKAATYCNLIAATVPI